MVSSTDTPGQALLRRAHLRRFRSESNTLNKRDGQCVQALAGCCLAAVFASTAVFLSTGLMAGTLEEREIDSYSSPEISGEIKLCEAGECSYLRPLRTNILKSILIDTLARKFQKRK